MIIGITCSSVDRNGAAHCRACHATFNNEKSLDVPWLTGIMCAPLRRLNLVTVGIHQQGNWGLTTLGQQLSRRTRQLDTLRSRVGNGQLTAR
jgi:hypothetical protein